MMAWAADGAGSNTEQGIKHMVFRTRLAWLMLAPALLAMVFAACGGDDDDDGGSTSGATGSDAAFVSSICKAFLTFSTDLDKVMADASSITDEKAAAKKFAEPFDKLAKSFSDAKPPKDVKDWHSQASKTLTNAAKAMKDGDLAALEGIDDLPDMPAGASERLEKLATDNKDCQAADFAFGE